MSCGEPHETDCSKVLEEVFLYLDGEMSYGDLQPDAIRVHLEECAPCLHEYGIDQMVIRLVASCCGGDQAPDRLREQVRDKLAQIRRELSVVEYRAD